MHDYYNFIDILGSIKKCMTTTLNLHDCGSFVYIIARTHNRIRLTLTIITLLLTDDCICDTRTCSSTVGSVYSVSLSCAIAKHTIEKRKGQMNEYKMETSFE
jgi:hypothetical protein